MTDRLLASPATAALLDVPVRTLDNWAYHRVGPAYFRVGKHRRYRESDVLAWLETRRVETGDRP